MTEYERKSSMLRLTRLLRVSLAMLPPASFLFSLTPFG